MNKTLRYAFYGRVSTAAQAERDTIRHQIFAYEEHRKRHDYTPTEIYEDDAESGELPMHKRPGGRKLLADAKAGAFDVLVVYSISRLARTTLESLSIVKRLKEDHGIAFMSINEPVDTSTPAGWLTFVSLAAIYEFEKETIRDRTKKGKDALMREGLLPDGKTRYGWRRENLDRTRRQRHESRLIEHELEAPVVREIFRLSTVERMGSVMIADLLNVRQVPPPMTGKRLKEQHLGIWHPGVVRQILRREAYYTGRVPYNTTRRVKKDGEVIGRAANEPEAWIWVEAPPLIDRATFEAARENLAENHRKMNRTGVRQYPLRGRFSCLQCDGLNFAGRIAYYHLASGEKVERPFYSCLSRWKRGSPNKCNTNLPAASLEEQVWEHVKQLLGNADSYVDEAVAEWERRNAVELPTPEPEEDLEHVTECLKRLDDQSQAIRDMVRTGFATQEEAAKDMQKVRADQARLKAIQARLLEAPRRAGRADVAHAAKMAKHFLSQLHEAIHEAEGNAETRETLIRALLIRIEVNGPSAEAIYDAEPPALGTGNPTPSLSRLRVGLPVRRMVFVAV
jgi:site-specific DNA recombinase